MSYMLDGAGEILNLEILDTSKVTNMGNMFSGCYGGETLDLSSFDTSNVIDMSHMFAACKTKKLIVSSFDTRKGENMEYMFTLLYYGHETETLDLSDFDTSNVTDMSNMFLYCSKVRVDVSSFNTKKNARISD